MGLQDAFKKAAIAAFTAADDLVTSVSYRSKTAASATYDPTTGAVTSAYTDYTVSMIFARYENKQIDGNTILTTDEKALIPVDRVNSNINVAF